MKSIVLAIHERMDQLEEQVLRSSSNEWLLEMSQWHNLNEWLIRNGYGTKYKG